MKLELLHPYKSIETLLIDELPNFTVLIGRNGSGKTQILTALAEGQANISGIGPKDIELYDMGSFHPSNAGSANRNANTFAKSTADAFLLGRGDRRPLIDIAVELFTQFGQELGIHERDEFERELRNEIINLQDFTIISPNEGHDSPYKRALYKEVIAPFIPQQNRRQQNRVDNSFNGNQAILLSMAMKLGGKLPQELTYDDIMRASHYEGGTISNSISSVFASYKVDQFIWAHSRIETKPVAYADLVAEYRTKYPPPWETLREILSTMRVAAREDGLFDFDF